MSASVLTAAADRPTRGLADRVQQFLANLILPLPGGHPAVTFRGERA